MNEKELLEHVMAADILILTHLLETRQKGVRHNEKQSARSHGDYQKQAVDLIKRNRQLLISRL